MAFFITSQDRQTQVLAGDAMATKTGCTARKMAFFITSQDRQTQVLAGDAMATTIIMISMIIVTGKMFRCYCL